MNAAKFTLTSTILAAAFGLALGLMSAPGDSYACHKNDQPHGNQTDCGGGGGGGGGITRIMATITDDPALSLADDGGPYSDSERDIKANAGPGIFIGLRGTGNDPRTVRVNVNCTDVLPDGTSIGDCSLLLSGAFNVQTANVFLAVRPYAVNCPDPTLPDENCLNVFSLFPEASAEMGFTVRFAEGIRLDIASDIGGSTALTPGRCLSNMTSVEREAFLDAFCRADEGAAGDFTDCNVTVTAHASVLDGPNDSWDIVADGDTGLICSARTPGEIFVIGVATDVTFIIEADVE